MKLRRQAQLPPEALEPLSAFRGDTRWSFDSRERLQQKLEGLKLGRLLAVLTSYTTFFSWFSMLIAIITTIRVTIIVIVLLYITITTIVIVITIFTKIISGPQACSKPSRR